MDEQKFVETCKVLIKDFYEGELKQEITIEDIYTVWLCKILQNNKAMLSTTIPDTRYFEITYNGDKNEWYFDSYVKEKNQLITL